MQRHTKAMINSLLVALSLFAAAGCRGPLAVPMVERLDDQQQAKVDGVWNVMLDAQPPIDRTLLLDVVLLQQLHQLGVDSLQLTNTKRVGAGYVEMHIQFERDKPDLDEFSIAYFDALGLEIRRERYTRTDIKDRIAFFGGSTLVDEPATPEALEAQERRNTEREARMQEIETLLAPVMKDESPEDIAPEPPFPLVIMPG